MAALYIQDHNEYQIVITDGLRAWYIPKFRIYMTVTEPYLYLYWNDREQGDGGDSRLLIIDYRDVADGYSGYLDNPSSAADLKQTISEYIVSGFSGGSTGDLLNAKAQLLSHDGVSDTILAAGTNEYFLQRDDSTATGLKWVAGSVAVAAGLTAQHSISKSGSTINLVNDEASPGNTKYYGTNSSGTKGYYDLVASRKKYFSDVTTIAGPASVATEILKTYTIPAGAVSNGDTVELHCGTQFTSNSAGSKTFRVYVNTANNLSGAVLFWSWAAANASGVVVPFMCRLPIIAKSSGSNTLFIGATTTTPYSIGQMANAGGANIPLGSAWYIHICCVKINTGDVMQHDWSSIYIDKA